MLTFIRFTNIVIVVQSRCLSGVFDMQGDLLLHIETEVAVTEHVHHKGEGSDLRRRLELHLEGLHVECRLTSLVEDRLVKCREDERWYGHLSLSGIGQENVPAGRVVAGQIWCVSQWWLYGFEFVLSLFVTGTVLGGLPAHDSVEIILIRVGVLEISRFNFRHVRVTRRNKSCLHNQLNQAARGDGLLSHNLEKCPGDFESRKLFSDGNCGVILLV